MNEITIRLKDVVFGDSSVNSVDARELHAALESGQEFANWIKNKVTLNPFMKHEVDWIVFDKAIINPFNAGSTGGRPRKDYAITKEAAKKVAMAEQTPRGEAVREYFLKCERIAESGIPEGLPNFLDPAASAIAWAEQYRAKQVAELKLEEAQPKIAFYDAVTDDDEKLWKFSEVAKEIRMYGPGKDRPLGQNTLYDYCRSIGLIIKRGTEPLQEAVNSGKFKVVESPYSQNGVKYVNTVTKFTQVGIDYVLKMLTEDGYVKR